MKRLLFIEVRINMYMSQWAQKVLGPFLFCHDTCTPFSLTLKLWISGICPQASVLFLVTAICIDPRGCEPMEHCHRSMPSWDQSHIPQSHHIKARFPTFSQTFCLKPPLGSHHVKFSFYCLLVTRISVLIILGIGKSLDPVFKVHLG